MVVKPRRGLEKMHSFWMDVLPEPGAVFRLPPEEESHLFRILRARPGETVRLLDGKGGSAEAEVRSGRELELVSRRTAPVPEQQLILACAAPRRQKLDTLLKQAVELGAWEIRLMQCARSVAKPEGASRWQTLLREACKQSGNLFLPRIEVHDSLADALDSLADARLFFGAVRPPDAPFPPVPAAGRSVFLAGPEGGFTPEEEAALAARGAVGISLGPWILRLETAAVAGLAVLRTRGAE